MCACSRSANLWVGNDLHSAKDGDLFDGTGALWNCNERLCPACLAERSRRSRATARAAILRPRLQKGELWRFVTLTMPTLPADKSPLLDTIRVVARAWRLFSKRDWWQHTVSAGVKGIEFTLGNPRKLENQGREWSPEIDGYHVHVHLLILSGWVEWRKLRLEWSECLREAWAEAGLQDQKINTKDGLAVCDVRLVTSRKGRTTRSAISGEGAICEVAKYLTKCESWDHIPESQLIEVASIERWPRMFELLGACRAPSKPRPLTPAISIPDDDPPYVVTVQDRLRSLWDSGDYASLYLFRSVRDELSQGALSEETYKVLRESTAYLDTPNLSAGGKPRAGPIIAPRRRRRALREFGAELIASGCRKLWRQCLAGLVDQRQSFRRVFQSRTFPYATFRDLGGRSWFGLRVFATGSPASGAVSSVA